MKTWQRRNRKCNINTPKCNVGGGQGRCPAQKACAFAPLVDPLERFAGIEGVKRLSDLPIGQSAQILCSGCERGAYRRRLLDMGMTRGTIVKVKKIAPLGDPINLEVRGYELCLRKCDISNIIVKTIS